MNIAWINITDCTVDYSSAAGDDDSSIVEYTNKFEKEFNVSDGNDIGGLIVYSDRCVYDYENFRGWVK
jgi:hypothetical protein